MRSRRSRAAARVIQPRSAATISAMTPKPEPPIVTGSVVARALAARAPIEGQTADGMRAFPEIAERLALHGLEQRVVRRAPRASRDLSSPPRARPFAAGGTLREWLRAPANLCGTGDLRTSALRPPCHGVSDFRAEEVMIVSMSRIDKLIARMTLAGEAGPTHDDLGVVRGHRARHRRRFHGLDPQRHPRQPAEPRRREARSRHAANRRRGIAARHSAPDRVRRDPRSPHDLSRAARGGRDVRSARSGSSRRAKPRGRRRPTASR